jgi:hypothetical protein
VDVIANGTEPPFSDVPGEPDEVDDLTWSHPSTLAIASVVLASLSLLGASVFRGIAYTASFADGNAFANTDTEGGVNTVVAGAFLSAAFAVIPLVLALVGLRKVVPTDGRWTPHLLRAGALLAGLSLLLHLVLAVIVAGADQPLSGYFSALSA